MTAPHATPHPLLKGFIDDLRAIWAANSETATRMELARPLLQKLVLNPQLQAMSENWPSTEGRKNLLLYVDFEYQFVINAVVRVPGRQGSIHDHAHAWVLYGILCGSESLERFERMDDGTREGYAEVRLHSVSNGRPGSVDLVKPGEIHAEQGGPERSVAIILRSAKLGKVIQNRYDMERRTILPGPGPQQIPFELTA
jgi:predicted metal-dependent enzyme (double-stranded beta helix superfamily)